MADIADRRLIINADDLGVSPGVNRGILEAHAAGTVTSASLLANAPGLADAVRRLQDTATLQVGLHFNLTVGSPVLGPEVASLCNPRTREFHSLRSLIGRALAGRIDPDDVAAECLAQLEVLRSSGVTVRHIDSHRHVHVLPGVWGPVIAVARGAGVHAVRLPREPLGGHNRLSRHLVVASLRAASRVAANGNGRAPIRADHFRGLGLLGAVDFHHRLLVLLDQLEAGVTELMVHPGYVDRDLAAWDSYTAGRERELAALCSREVRHRLTRGNVQLVA